MNDSKNSSKGLLVVRFPQAMTKDQIEYLYESINPVAEDLNLEALVLGNDADARVEVDYSSLLTRLCVAVERLVAQGEPPALSEEIAPPALNARPTGLNSRPLGDSEGMLNVSTEGTFVLQRGEKVTPRG